MLWEDEERWWRPRPPSQWGISWLASSGKSPWEPWHVLLTQLCAASDPAAISSDAWSGNSSHRWKTGAAPELSCCWTSSTGAQIYSKTCPWTHQDPSGPWRPSVIKRSFNINQKCSQYFIILIFDFTSLNISHRINFLKSVTKEFDGFINMNQMFFF